MILRYVVTIDPEASRDAELERLEGMQSNAILTNPQPAKAAPDEFVFDTWDEVIEHIKALKVESYADYGILINCRMNPTGGELSVPRPTGPSMAPRPTGQPARR